MDISVTAKRLASLGHEKRLELFLVLFRAGRVGLTVGDLQSELDCPPSTLAFHLRELVSAGLVSQSKEGRSVRSFACYEVLDDMVKFLTVNCCTPGVKKAK
jgi:ArsR family transcriptional regulator, arsenate/arsenite/antimonite-responsive transcriptional repressor